MSNRISGSISFINRTVSSIRLKVLYEESVHLIEETSLYFDREGKVLSKTLPPVVVNLYTSESILLTTRLMQMVSWLLLQRALEDGDMSLEQVISEKDKIKFDYSHLDYTVTGWNDLPCFFRNLVERSLQLQKRIVLLDQEIYNTNLNDLSLYRSNHVQTQMKLLEACFENF
ncbi:DUF1465 family protein [Candidatus Liberibacter africanus]|uniref:Regulator of CtrA degradation n=1 Tax=Candidatus Liberibacter africanus PTSAPSY TaxID=1277257 RepID=A0A0G3I2Z8_LIBAF|nr:DUF1465 family protein [Candidatus Liberibacter africanus]AKK20264.1 hypothetical protein G293_03180 [Candidatus Liberibacter africanus PTSAPSY]QTP64027.1 DUF1465 family protein [Candidatus Liberibacter africanus]